MFTIESILAKKIQKDTKESHVDEKDSGRHAFKNDLNPFVAKSERAAPVTGSCSTLVKPIPIRPEAIETQCSYFMPPGYLSLQYKFTSNSQLHNPSEQMLPLNLQIKRESPVCDDEKNSLGNMKQDRLKQSSQLTLPSSFPYYLQTSERVDDRNRNLAKSTHASVSTSLNSHFQSSILCEETDDSKSRSTPVSPDIKRYNGTFTPTSNSLSESSQSLLRGNFCKPMPAVPASSNPFMPHLRLSQDSIVSPVHRPPITKYHVNSFSAPVVDPVNNVFIRQFVDRRPTQFLPYCQMYKSSVGRCPRRGGQVRFTGEQTKHLENVFSCQKYITPPHRKQLAEKLGLHEKQVKTWFQNRRAKWRKVKNMENSEDEEDPRINSCSPPETICSEQMEDEDDSDMEENETTMKMNIVKTT